jgi:hypothetical protein
MELIDKSYNFLKIVLNSTLDLSVEKTLIINSLNILFEEQYIKGLTDRLIVVSVTKGDKSYKQSMSVNSLRSGFMLLIKNDDQLSITEAQEISEIILNDKPFIRKLIILGFDTLVVKGNNTQTLKFKLSDKEENSALTHQYIDNKTKTKDEKPKPLSTEAKVIAIIVTIVFIILIFALSQ